jgi:hypothetical protein
MAAILAVSFGSTAAGALASGHARYVRHHGNDVQYKIVV